MAARAGGPRSLLPAVVVGIGIGGFFDGIVLHQILQWHHVVSGRVPPDTLAGLQTNTFVDGLFHQTMWLTVVVGVLLFARELGTRGEPDALRRLVSGSLIGFGLFNVADQVLFHVVLELHHIRPGPDQAFWDVAYTAWGIAMVAAGWWLLPTSHGRWYRRSP